MTISTQDLGIKNHFETPMIATSTFINETEHVCEVCNKIYYCRRSITINNMFDTERTHCDCTVKLKLAGEKPASFNFLNIWNMVNDNTYNRMTFDKFKPSDADQDKLLKNMQRYAEIFKPGTKGLNLFGLPGRGKTHLLIAAAKEIQAKGFNVLVIKTTDLLARLKKSYQSKSDEQEFEILNALRNVDFLVLDDLGAEKITGWVREKLYYAIDYRYMRATTAYTTNLSGEEMAKEMPAIASRVFSKEINYQVYVTGQDRRLADFSDVGKEVGLFELEMRR